MNARTRWLRLLAGVGVLVMVLIVTFGIALAVIPTWGAAPGEALMGLPGDELAPRPLINWTNVIEIDALIRLGRIEAATARAEAFGRRYPSSAHRTRIARLLQRAAGDHE